MKHKTKQRLINNVAAFVEKYHDIRLHPAQKKMIKAIMSGKRIVISRPRPYDRTLFYRELKKAFESGKVVIDRKPLIIADEANSIPTDWFEAKRKEWGEKSPMWEEYVNGNWPAECFGVDVARGKDKTVTVRTPKEDL